MRERELLFTVKKKKKEKKKEKKTMQDDKTPISERTSAHSRNLDEAKDGAGVLRVMAACDRELYANHWGGHPGLANPAVMSTIAELADVVAECIRANVAVVGDHRDVDGGATNNKRARREDRAPDDDGSNRKKKSHGRAAVFIAGAGTSGRLAFLAARTANDTLTARGEPPCFHHIIAGGTPALFQCVESAEDDAAAAVADFDAALAAAGGDDISDAIIIGVSCGLSATYVSTQLARAMDDPKGRFTVACVGFNPRKFARANQPGGDGGGGGGGGVRSEEEEARKRRQGGSTGASFRDVLWRMEEDEGGILCASSSGGGGMRLRRRLIITPVIGPEAVTGSSRLKGGTATKLVLDAAFTAAMVLIAADGDEDAAAVAAAAATTSALVKEALVAGAAATRAGSFSSSTTGLPAVVDAASRCLSSGGQVHYLGGGGAGILGLIDASEQVPTFGARRTDVQGWIDGGWTGLALCQDDADDRGRADQSSYH